MKRIADHLPAAGRQRPPVEVLKGPAFFDILLEAIQDRESVARILDSTGGLALMLASAKARLEHGVELNVVGRRHPARLVESWKEGRAAPALNGCHVPPSPSSCAPAC